MESVVLGGGCFWCVEAVFQRINGVEKVTNGYAGGSKEDPSYEEVCSGRTGHAEVCKIDFNPALISLQEILEIFFKTHDPTQLNRQGNDVGPQYRSSVFYKDEEQKQIVQDTVESIKAQYTAPIVTTLEPLNTFYPAENYHQDYYRRNPGNPYCFYVIRPKVGKTQELFSQKLK